MESYGFDHAIDHRTLPKRTGEVGNYDWTLRKEELKKRLKAVAPNGIDMYYDNVGEAHFEAVFECCAVKEELLFVVVLPVTTMQYQQNHVYTQDE